jgi:glutamyl-tRNA synthetase
MPDEDLSWTDLVRGTITFAAGSVPDFVVVRATGDPLYTLVNPVDDAMMRISHVIRGEDLLPSTPRQIALYRALVEIGVAERVPEFGHLPYVMGEGNKKLSKRDPQASIYGYRDAGFLPEGMINYLALLGWSIADDRDIFTPTELVAAFDGSKISVNPARFDGKKMLAINATHLRLLTSADFAGRLTGFLTRAGLIGEQPTDVERALIAGAAPLVQERVQTLAEGAEMLRFLFVADADLKLDEVAVGKQLGETGQPVLAAAIAALEPVTDWTTAAIEEALRVELIERLELKPRTAFGPLRVAVTGRQVSPPLFESMELLGRDSSLARLRAAAG